MDKIINHEPKKYPETSIPEGKAITTFEYIVEHKYVKPYLKEMDKTPNYDGYIELTDERQCPIGQIEVQVKKLPDEVLTDPRYQCDMGFLAYCETSLRPFFLIGVDITNSIAYWVLIDRDFLEKLQLKKEQKSVLVKFPKGNIVRKGNCDYFPLWEKIVEDYRTKLFNYDSIKKRLEELTVGYEMLIKKSDPAYGEERSEFAEIHRFLDCLNLELDTNFEIVKSMFYGPCWKLGMAYSDYSKNGVSYIIYPILYDKNDVQIKYITPKLKDMLMQKGLPFTTYYDKNDIFSRPKGYALEIIYRDIKEIIERKALPIHNSVIAREFIFSFLDSLHIPLGLELKNKYTTEEIKFAFYQYLPVWVEESLRGGGVRLGHQKFIDPHLILIQLSDPRRQQIAERVKEKLSKKEYSSRTSPLGSGKYPFWLFADFLKYLEDSSISELERLYIPRDYERVKTKSSLIWSYFTPADVRKNIQTLFSELPVVYESFIESYFPSLKSQLSFFNNFDRLIIVINVKEEYKDWKNVPTIEYYYLKSDNFKESKIDIYLKTDENVPINKSTKLDTDIEIEGKIYRLWGISEAILDFIYQELPMLTCTYKLLDEKFRSYFKI